MILKDRVAIVTGAGSGIGQGAAEIMAREGAIVIAADRDAAAGAETADRIHSSGGRCEAVATDVSQDTALASLVDRVITAHSRIDILHNHAGIQVAGTLESVDPAGMDRSWNINVRAHFMLARLVVPHMRRQGGGVILNTASNSGVFYDREMIAYTTSKHAVVAMTRQMAVDYARDNIRVNAFCPGWVDTPFNAPFIAQMGGRAAIDAYIEQQIPLRRWATVAEVSESVLYLVSDRSAFMTGHALVLDGGESIG